MKNKKIWIFNEICHNFISTCYAISHVNIKSTDNNLKNPYGKQWYAPILDYSQYWIDTAFLLPFSKQESIQQRFRSDILFRERQSNPGQAGTV